MICGLDEQRMHFARGQPIRQPRSKERAGADADKHIAIVEADALERFIQSDKRSNLVNTSQRPAARERDAHGMRP